MALPPPTPNQSRVIWLALTTLALTAIVACLVALIWALGKVLQLFAPVLWPLAVAAVLAYLLDPLVDLLERRKMKRQRAIVWVFAVAVFVIVGIGAAILPRLIFDTREPASKIPAYAQTLQQRAVDWIETSGWQWPLNQRKETPPPATNVVTTAPEPVVTPASTNTTPEVPWERRLAGAAVSWLPKALPKI